MQRTREGSNALGREIFQLISTLQSSRQAMFEQISTGNLNYQENVGENSEERDGLRPEDSLPGESSDEDEGPLA